MADKAGGASHDLNCLTIKELEAHAYNLMDKQTRDYVSLYGEKMQPLSLR